MKDWTPREYQLRAAKFLVGRSAAGLWLDPSLGKTSITLAAYSALRREGRAGKALVIAPLRVCHHVWPVQVKEWRDFSHLKIQVLHGKDKDKIDTSADMYAINPEGLAWFLRASTATGSLTIDTRRIRELGINTLIIDELTRYKSTSSKGYKMLKKALPNFKRRWGLTGSPAANRFLDLFGQCYVLDGGAALGPYITHFKNKYFTPDYMGYNWTLKPGADALVYDRIAPLFLRMAAEDYLQLPQVVESTIEVELTPGTDKIYRELFSALVAKLSESETIVASNVADCLNKCRQVVGGALYTEDDGTGSRGYTVLSSEKLDALEELVNELQGQPLLVGYEFLHEGQRIKERFPDAVIAGELSTKKLEQTIEAWNRGDIALMAAHPQTIGHGLNLQGACRHVCWYTSTWNGELDDQFIRRIRRHGNQHSTVYVHRLVAPGTIDDVVIGTLRSKEKTQAALFQGVAKLARGE